MSDEAVNWVTIAEAVKTTGKSDRTLRRWVSSGKLPHKREGRRLWVDLSGLDLPTDYDTVIDNDKTNDKVTIARLEAELQGMTREVVRLDETLALARRELERWQGQAAALTATVAEQQTLLAAPERPRRRWRWWPWGGQGED